MAGYWKSVRSQAWRETRETVRLDQWGRVVLWTALLGAAAVTAPTLVEGATRAMAVVGVTAIVGLGIFLLKIVAIPPRLAASVDADHAATAAKLRALESPTSPARDPDGVYQWDEKVGSVGEVRQEVDKGRITFGTLSAGDRFSKDNVFQYRSFKLRFVSCDGGAGIHFGSQVGGVDRQHSSSFTWRNVICEVVG